MELETQRRPRWSDLEEEEEKENYDLLLPQKQVIGPDEHGLIKVIEYKFNNEGKLVKVTTSRRVHNVSSKRVHSWVKFGDVGTGLTSISNEEIVFERPSVSGTKAEDSVAQVSIGDSPLMVCRTCGKKGDHWTVKCPDKDLAQPSETFFANPSPADSLTTRAYVPPTRRDGGVRPTRSNDENSVRVNNLSEDTREADLLELFSKFGNVSRVHIAMDQKTGMSRGFGFVNFVRREDGEKAIAKLNGYGYDHLILSVEWAAPRAC